MRDQYIRSGDGFLLVFSIDNRRSFEFIPELRDAVLRVLDVEAFPMVLVGTKCDLEMSRKTIPMEASDLANTFRCPFIEVSAKSRTRIEDPFFLLVQEMRYYAEQNTKAAHKKKKKSSGKCSIL